MNLTHKCVMHHTFGEGVVTRQDDALLHVSFPGAGEKVFLFPDAFQSHLSIADEDSRAWVCELLKKKTAAQKIEKKRHERELLRAFQEEQRQDEIEKLLQAHRIGKAKLHPQSQIVFCCDEEPLSDVFRKKEIYCGKVTAGGKDPRFVRAARLRPNSAGLLTVKPEGEPESKRMIAGAFLVGGTFYGTDRSDGTVPFHPDYILNFTAQAKSMPLFEPYRGELPPIGRVRYRYFDNRRMAELLSDLAYHNRGTPNAAPCARFLHAFCRLNNIATDSLPKHGDA